MKMSVTRALAEIKRLDDRIHAQHACAMTKKFRVSLGPYGTRNGRFYNRRPLGDLVAQIFSDLHQKSSHSPLGPKWKNAERRMVARYAPALYTMIRQKIKKERL